MKWVKKALAVTLAVMLVLPSIGALADETEPAAASGAVEQKLAMEPEGEVANEETVSGDTVPAKKSPVKNTNEPSANADEAAGVNGSSGSADTDGTVEANGSSVSVNVLQPEVELVQYNTENCVISVVNKETFAYMDTLEDEEALNSFMETSLPGVNPQLLVPFDDNGNTIHIPEANPFFPYEVQFTCQGKTWSEWFMSPEDTVEVGGHRFYIDASFDDTAITRLSLNVAGDTIPVFPEPKTFTNDGDGAAPMSYLPLTEKNLGTVDLSDYAPVDLSMVSVDAVIGRANDTLAPGNAGKIAWAYGRGNEDFKVCDADGGVIDLSWGTGSYQKELQMIAGDGNQLNTDNIRNIVKINTASSQDWLVPTIYIQDHAGVRSKAEIFETDYHDYDEDERNLRVEYDNKDIDKESSVYLSLAIAPSVKHKYDHIRIYEGAYTTADAAMRGKDITAQLMAADMAQLNTGYLFSGYEQDITMVAFDAGNHVTGILPFSLKMYNESESMSINLYTLNETKNKENVADYFRNTGMSDDCAEMNCVLYKEYPANAIYYWEMDYRKDGVENNSDVTAAYVGKYDSIAAAQAAGAKDIKNTLSVGWPADYSKGVYFTVFIGADGSADQKVYKYKVTTETGTKSRYEHILNSGTAVRFTGFLDGSGNKIDASEKLYFVPYDTDSYGENNYRTVLVANDVDLTNLAPLFETADGVHLYAPGSRTPEQSGGRYYNFADGPVQFTASAEDGKNGKNYWLQVKKAVAGKGQLYINSLADPDANTYEKDGVVYSTREMMLDGYHDYVHDICVSNIGDADIPGLTVELDSDVLQLDEYWTLSEEFDLSGFGTTKKDWLNASHGELPNLAKVRLRAKDYIGAGIDISGTLTFKSEGKTLLVLNLTGTVGDPCIITPYIPSAVKYVPYGSMIQNNNKYSWNRITYYIRNGKLPEGMVLKPNGEIYGVPKEKGSFEFTIVLTNSMSRMKNSERTFTLWVYDNSNSNVYHASDAGYKLLTPVGERNPDAPADLSTVSSVDWKKMENIYYDFYLDDFKSDLFVSEGKFEEFIDFWLNGEKLVKGVDYLAESGSTRITISAQTMKNKALQSGNNTIAAEFREGGDINKTLRRTAQNFHLDRNTQSSARHRGGGSGGSGGRNSSNETASTGGVTIAGCILDANNNHLAGVTVELHSTPRSTVTDESGFFQFAGVEYGQHELFVNDQAGNILASQKFELREGDAMALDGFVLTVPKGATVPLAVRVANGALSFSVTGDAAQAAAVYAASAVTGDESRLIGWLLALAVSGCLAAGIVISSGKRIKG